MINTVTKIKKLIIYNYIFIFLNKKSMSSVLYHGFEMSNLEQYTINCKNCSKQVKVFKATLGSIPAPIPKNIGRYYYSCKDTNNNNCKFFRWFEHKWPKVKADYQVPNTQLNMVDDSSTIIESEMQSLIGQLGYIEIHSEELSKQDKIEIKSLLTQLKTKITASNINEGKKIAYFKVLSDLMKIV